MSSSLSCIYCGLTVSCTCVVLSCCYIWVMYRSSGILYLSLCYRTYICIFTVLYSHTAVFLFLLHCSCFCPHFLLHCPYGCHHSVCASWIFVSKFQYLICVVCFRNSKKSWDGSKNTIVVTTLPVNLIHSLHPNYVKCSTLCYDHCQYASFNSSRLSYVLISYSLKQWMKFGAVLILCQV